MPSVSANPSEVVHLNERDPVLRAATDGRTPCVVARTGDDIVEVLGSSELEACAGDVDAFRAALMTALDRLGVPVPTVG